MNQSPQNPDCIDRLLSDFFKSQVPYPWPSAPVSEASRAEASVLTTARESRRASDPGRRPRLTLAVSVALLLGALWFMSAGSTPGPRPQGAPKPGTGTIDVIGQGTANLPKELHKDQKENKDGKGFKPGPITLP